MSNEDIRVEMKKKRSSMPYTDVETYSDLIFNKILSLDFVFRHDSFFVYKDFKNEVQTRKLIEYLLSLGKTVAHPITVGENMIPAIPNGADVSYDRFGIEIPKSYSVMESAEVIFVPLLACDTSKNRIGFGKGYYDRYMQGKSALKIGLCYDFQVVDGISANEWDVPLDVIITEKRIMGLSHLGITE